MGSRPSPTGYWCYQCSRLIRLTSNGAPLVCPLCNGEYLEEVEDGPRSQLLEAISVEGDAERRPSSVLLLEAMSNLLNQLQDHRREEDGGFRPPFIFVRGGHRGRDDNGGGMSFILGTESEAMSNLLNRQQQPADNRQGQPAYNGQQHPRSTTRGSAPVDASTLAIASTRQGGWASNSNVVPIRVNRAHHGSGDSQGRRSFFNFNWWPFRASNSSDAVNSMRSGWPFDDESDHFRWFN